MLLRALAGLGLLGGVIASLSGCSSKSSTPAGLADCPECKPSSVGGSAPGAGGGSGTPTGAGGDAGTTAVGGAGGAAPGENLSGSVISFSDDTLVTHTPYLAGVVTITAPSSSTTMAFATAQSSAGAYTLVNVTSGVQWLRTQPVSAGSDVFGVYEPVSIPAMTATIDVHVLQRSALTPLFAQLPAPTQADANASHVIAQVVDTTGNPVSGITVTPSFTYAGGMPFYDSGPGYDLGGTTKTRGMAIFLNGASSGSADTITLSKSGTTLATYALRLAPDTVTVVALGIP